MIYIHLTVLQGGNNNLKTKLKQVCFYIFLKCSQLGKYNFFTSFIGFHSSILSPGLYGKYILGTPIISVLCFLSGCASSPEACQKVSIAPQVLSELLL